MKNVTENYDSCTYFFIKMHINEVKKFEKPLHAAIILITR